MSEDFVTSFDGSLIEVRAVGENAGLPLLLVNGIGAREAIWREVTKSLARSGRVATWDYRGLHGSSPPATDRLDPGAHAEDAVAAMDHLELDQAGIIGWSTGGRVALELAHRYPHRVAALAMVNAGYGHPLRRVLRLEISSTLPMLAGIAKHFSHPLQRWLADFVARPEIAGFVRQSGMTAPTADIPALVDHLDELASCDGRRLLATFEAVVGDSAEPILEEIEAPTLIIGGRRDAWTAPAMLEEMEEKIPGATLEMYEAATHFLPAEHPARLSSELGEFFANRANFPQENSTRAQS